MKNSNKSGLLQQAKQKLLKRMLTPQRSSDRFSPNGTPADPAEFALWSIGRHAEAEAAKIVISGRDTKLLPEIGQLDSHLRELEISDTEISDFSPLTRLPSLETLKVNATKIVDWSWLSSLKNLRKLELHSNGTSPVNVPDLPELVDIKIFNTRGKITLGYLPKLEKAEFQVLEDLAEVTKQPKLVDLAFQKIGNRSLDSLRNAANLRLLRARLDGAIDLHPLASLSSLIELKLTAPEVTDISGISQLVSLETLELNDLNLSDAGSLKDLTQMRALTLRLATPLSDLSFLSDMSQLSGLVLRPAVDADLRHLTGLPNLQDVGLVEISPQTILSPLTQCKELRRLKLSTDENANGPFSGLLPAPANLESLLLSGQVIESLNGLEKCRDLQDLRCSRTSIGSLEPLNGMTQLRQIFVSESKVSDLSVLGTLPCFLAEHPDIKLAIQDTPAVEQYPELAKMFGGSPLHQYEYGQHETAVNAVRAVTRGV